MKSMNKTKKSLLVATVLCGLALTQPVYAADFTDDITGYLEQDTVYIDSGIMDPETGEYTFTDAKNTITVTESNVCAGPMVMEIGAAISSAESWDIESDVPVPPTTLNMNRNDLDVSMVDPDWGVIGIGAGAVFDKGKVNIKDAGNINVFARGNGLAAGIFANAGSEVYIDNAGYDADGNPYVLKIDCKSLYPQSAVGIKTMNGRNGVTSKITITGLVDVVADGALDEDGYGANEAVSAVASTIEICGGNIVAKNGAWAAIRAYGEFVSENYGIVNVNIVKDEEGNIIGAGNNKTTITGDIVTNGGMGTKGKISVGLNGKDSFWEGNYGDNVGYGVTPGQLGNVNVFVKNGAHWKGFSTGAVALDLSGAGSYWYGFSTSEKMLLQLKDGAIWQNAITTEQRDRDDNIIDSRVGTFIGDGGYIDMTGRKLFKAYATNLSGSPTSGANTSIEESTDGITGNLVIDNYSGNTTVLYKHESVSNGVQTLALDDEGATPNASRVGIVGGNVTIRSATANSSITLRTDQYGIDLNDRNLVEDTLNSLARKLYYTGYANGENNLTGYAQIAEGLTSATVSKALGNIDFSTVDGQGSINSDSVSVSDIVYGDSETAMMRGAKSAMASTVMMWRAENDDMMKRLGEVRGEQEEAGLWAKYYTGKSEMDAQKAKFKVDYDAYQIGYDKQIGNDWLLGAAFSYNDGESQYQLGSKGDNTVSSLSVYGTKKASNGTYIDLVAKVSQLDNDYTIYNDTQHKLSGDYDTWGVSFSAEYGKRFEQKNGVYIDPSVQFTIGHIDGKSYKATSDYLDVQGNARNLYVLQRSMDSVVGKVGIGIGQKTERANYFAKFALAHEFGGDFNTDFRADGEIASHTNIDFGGTWCELELGGGVQISDSTMLYATYERSFSGDVKEKYRIDGGVRFSF